MKVGIYDPYLNTLGGGERYIVEIAKSFLDDHEVSLFWNQSNILSELEERFGLKLPGLTVRPNIFGTETSLKKRLLVSREFDYFFYISDGSFPLLLSKKIFPILQFPLSLPSQKTLKTRLKFRNVSAVLCYSEFVKSYLEDTFTVPVKVLYPAVNQIGQVGKKEKIILSVGRFTRGNNKKNQEVLIKLFNDHHKDFPGWKLVLAGGVLPSDLDYVKDLKRSAGTDRVEFKVNPKFTELEHLYRRAKIYWHAAGYGSDIEKNPEFAEHFGITCVEAMSAGCVPVVFSGGGLKEIVKDGENGLTWDEPLGLLQKTLELIDNGNRLEELSREAIKRAHDFSSGNFSDELHHLVNEK